MNGIIHTCTHGDAIRPGEVLSEEQMVERIFAYTERLIRIAEPRKLVYLAIDGVAPRAKMNQQRSRRYRAPREAAMLAAQKERQGIKVDPAMQFDSNCITPGTEFLCALGDRYKTWVERSIADDAEWCRGLTVVFSGADVVGEGEHKIMDFIRRGRQAGDFDDDTHHCMCAVSLGAAPPPSASRHPPALPFLSSPSRALAFTRPFARGGVLSAPCRYGLDADLIMLSMVTHAPQFCLLRERQKFQKGRLAPRQRRSGPRGGAEIRDTSQVASSAEDDRDFIFLEIEMLRRSAAWEQGGWRRSPTQPSLDSASTQPRLSLDSASTQPPLSPTRPSLHSAQPRKRRLTLPDRAPCSCRVYAASWRVRCAPTRARSSTTRSV